jgi:hypothetical protein
LVSKFEIENSGLLHCARPGTFRDRDPAAAYAGHTAVSIDSAGMTAENMIFYSGNSRDIAICWLTDKAHGLSSVEIMRPYEIVEKVITFYR